MGGTISKKELPARGRKKLVDLAGGREPGSQDSRYHPTPSSTDLTDVVNTQTPTWARSQMG